MRFLSARPNARDTVAHIRNRASRTHRGMRLEGIVVARFDEALRRCEHRINLARRRALLAHARRRAAQLVIKRVVARVEERLGCGPLHWKTARRFDRLLLALAHDAEE